MQFASKKVYWKNHHLRVPNTCAILPLKKISEILPPPPPHQAGGTGGACPEIFDMYILILVVLVSPNPVIVKNNEQMHILYTSCCE